jgi:alpha-D-ribose 1-methylphosphonate 5-triphosphate diphosphatase
MNEFAIVNATIVLPDRVLDGGAVRVKDGLIAEATPTAAALGERPANQIDAVGAYLLPGIVELHNDGYEYELNPRPGANIPAPLAFATFERQLVSAGVTTEFHAISFMNRPSTGRSVSAAERASTYIAELRKDGFRPVDHQILHRLDVWSPDVLDMVFASVDRMPVRYLSLNDHTPGQGQFRDIDGYIARMKAYEETRGNTPLDVDGMLATIAERAADTETLPAIYGRLRAEHERRPLMIATHDDDSPQKVDFGWGLGARVAEFPVTVEAARRQRELGMPIMVGAPNIVRGGSQSGNLDARELIRLGLVDVICADYHAASLLPSAFMLADEGLMDLPTAVRMLSFNPARAVGLTDRGAIVPGLSADLVLARIDAAGFPSVEQAFRAGRQVFSFARTVASAALAARCSASPGPSRRPPWPRDRREP